MTAGRYEPFQVLSAGDGVDTSDELRALKERVGLLEVRLRQEANQLELTLDAGREPQREVKVLLEQLRGGLMALACLTGSRRVSREAARLQIGFLKLQTRTHQYGRGAPRP